METYKVTYRKYREHSWTGERYLAWQGSDTVLATSPKEARRKLQIFYKGEDIEILTCRNIDNTEARVRRAEYARNR